jgi:DNA-binding Lrp family transcriptional regulator
MPREQEPSLNTMSINSGPINTGPTVTTLDDVDLRLIAHLRRQPRSSVVQMARVVGIARGTAYSRLDRLESSGVISGYGPDVDPVRAGLGVLAFCTLEIVQGSHDATVDALKAIPQILEIHTITGSGDLLCRVVARSNDHLHAVLQHIAAVTTVRRSQTQLALSTSLHRTIADVLVGS